MHDILDLVRYPLHQPGTAAWSALVKNCQQELDREGMFNLEGFMKPEALAKAMTEIRPVMETLSFVHKRRHNVYFKKDVPGIEAGHPALNMVDTINHTVCADQIPQSTLMWVYEWPHFAVFLAAVMNKNVLYPMRDPLARANVMCYRDGEALNWHFDRSEFTTTLLLQAPSSGGDFEYRKDLRTAEDPNFAGVAKVLRGQDNDTRSLKLAAGTLNVFRGVNTLHRVTPCVGPNERYIAVLSYFERPGVMFSKEEQVGFYGRAA
ncbi:HalD/BesD family halogenase [Aestuariivirga litoralis]|uniref:HalD/BesD family halogenase n=1 Tax=Aestuariivirga litoralis TaxID=2650924 RepID=UPI0018C524F0|nr:2OG-Fe(II) oxygenase [Aestuariivirga litoralis]MBG1233059.1 2OG-Fe(II) oxygenase [Aestuariivirga litoralis]